MNFTRPKPALKLRNLGISTYKESVIYMRKDCDICKSEGFEVHARIKVEFNGKSLVATLNMISSEILKKGEASLSECARERLGCKDGDTVTVSHQPTIDSLSCMRAKIYGKSLRGEDFQAIINDIVADNYSDIQISSFLTACAGGRLSIEEIISLTRAMVNSGDSISWGRELVVDKHCAGGLPGNRTTPIVVAIAAAYGLTMPKTSSRAITSPAGTADTMEVLTPVDLSIAEMKKVVEQENGCIVWGGSVSLSPADDFLIRVEKALDLDGEGQLIASVLSKKISAGATHVLIDIPIGPTAKVRSIEMAEELGRYFEQTGAAMNLQVRVHMSDGTQPIGRGIGPALEARDIVMVLKNEKDAPEDLLIRALDLAGHMLEFSSDVKSGQGREIAEEILSSGKAWEKFQAICEAQGGMREIPKAKHTYDFKAQKAGEIQSIDNRRISRLAKLSGAPINKAAGIDLHVSVGSKVLLGEVLFTIHADSLGELDYALRYAEEQSNLIEIEEER